MRGERARSFGSVAELYDRARPSYPSELVDAVLSFAGPVEHALEVGAGTGKATALFAERGIAVHALEPSAEMAQIARRNLPAATVEMTDFESFGSGGRRFELIYSAQAWHWVSPEVRWVKSRKLLEPGGALALFWNRADWRANEIRDQLRAAYDRAIPNFGPMPGPMFPSDSSPPELWGNWRAEIERAEGFGQSEFLSFPWTRQYSTAEYLDLIRTHSDHIVLGPERLNALLDGVCRVIDDAGGRFTLDYIALLMLARAV